MHLHSFLLILDLKNCLRLSLPNLIYSYLNIPLIPPLASIWALTLKSRDQPWVHTLRVPTSYRGEEQLTGFWFQSLSSGAAVAHMSNFRTRPSPSTLTPSFVPWGVHWKLTPSRGFSTSDQHSPKTQRNVLATGISWFGDRCCGLVLSKTVSFKYVCIQDHGTAFFLVSLLLWGIHSSSQPRIRQMSVGHVPRGRCSSWC